MNESPREKGTNPRSKGTNPRAMGTNPRSLQTNQNGPKRRCTGIFIPVEILDDENLDNNDKILLAEIDSLDDPERGCYATNKYLSGKVKVTERTIQNCLKKLKKLGYIKIQVENYQFRTIKCNIKEKLHRDNLKKEAEKTWENEHETQATPHENFSPPHENDDMILSTRVSITRDIKYIHPNPETGEARIDKKFEPSEDFDFLLQLELSDVEKMRLMRHPVEKVRNAVGWALEQKNQKKLIACIIYALNNDLKPEKKTSLPLSQKHIERWIAWMNERMSRKNLNQRYRIEGDEFICYVVDYLYSPEQNTSYAIPKEHIIHKQHLYNSKLRNDLEEHLDLFSEIREQF